MGSWGIRDHSILLMGFLGGASGKEHLPASAGDIKDTGLIAGSGRSPGGGHGNPLQYSCLENPMDRVAWQATVHGVTKRQTRLKQLSTHAYTILFARGFSQPHSL